MYADFERIRPDEIPQKELKLAFAALIKHLDLVVWRQGPDSDDDTPEYVIKKEVDWD